MKIKIWKLIGLLVLVFCIGFEFGLFTHPLVNTEVTTYLYPGNYSVDIGSNLREVLNKTSYSNTTFKNPVSNWSSETITVR